MASQGTTDPSTGPAPTVVVNVPTGKQPADPGQEPATPTAPRKSKPLPWWKQPETILCVALTLILVELVLYVAVGWKWLLAGHLILIALILLVGSTIGRGQFWRGLGNLLRGRSPGGARNSGSNPTGRGRGSTGSPGKGLLGKLLPGRSRKGSGAPRRAGPGRGLLDNLLPGRGGRAGRPKAGSRTGAGPGRAGGGMPGRGGFWPFGRGKSGRPGSGSGPGKPSKGKPKNKGHKAGPGFFDVVADEWHKGWDEGTSKPEKTEKPSEGQPATSGPAGTKGSDGDMSRAYVPDADLYRWGEVLKGLPNVIDDTAGRVHRAVVEAEAVAGEVKRTAEQGASELPAGDALVATVQHIASEYESAARDAADAVNRMRKAQAEAEALHGQYERDHEHDLARARGERAPRHIEQRADVGNADI